MARRIHEDGAGPGGGLTQEAVLRNVTRAGELTSGRSGMSAS